ncbi:MAG TPA: alkaline phosphatase family protein [Vicinamibacterales bacterium]|nr:alkaline phosphatase family protein [Vicinamibacterales bacterium]
MRYLRLLSNALIAGLVGAAYLTILLLQLNPHLPVFDRVVIEWYAALSALYGVHLAVGCYGAMLLLEVIGVPVRGPAWVSVRLQAWFGTLLCGGAALLMWLNLRAFSVAIGEDAARGMAAGAIGATGVAAVLLSIAIASYSIGWRGSRAAAAILSLALGASLALPLAARGFGELRPPAAQPFTAPATAATSGGDTEASAGRVVLVLLEGASLDYLWPRAVEGRFPNFGRILDRGAAMDLATLRPTQPEPVWAAVATGKYPPRNGVPSSALYYVRSRTHAVQLLPDYCLAHALVRFGLVQAAPHSSSSWRARPLWSLLATRGISSGVVRWPVTYPAQPIRGFLISDRLHLVSRSLLRLVDETVAYPAEVLPAARDAFFDAPQAPEIAPVPVNASASGLEPLQEQPARWDRIYGRLARELSASIRPGLLAVRYAGIDAVGHTYLRYAMPRAFGNVSEADVRRHGAVLDRYYAFLDAEIGAQIATLGPDDLLLVVSGFGMEPMTVPKRLLAQLLGDVRMSGTHERAPDGFLLAYGARVRSGKLQRGAVVDVAPTILYYLGLPVGRDMDGFARTDLFVKEFSDSRPIVFIRSYETLMAGR